MRKTKIVGLIASIAMLLLPSCNRYELELYSDGKADVHFTYDWDSLFHLRPDGMTLMLAHDGDSISYYDPTNSIFERTMRLASGRYLLTVMNRTFGEYGTMRFYQRQSHNDIFAVSNTYHISTETAWDNGRTYMEEPEKIGVAVDTFTVPHTIDDLVFRNWQEDASDLSVHLEQPEVIMPMTTTLNIRVKVRGISYMRSMEGYVSGMADGFYLNQLWRRSEVGVLKLDRWERDRSYETAARVQPAADNTPTEENVGWMTTSVETFGLPHGRELLRWRTPESNYILLHFTLIDGRTVDFSYYVGRNIRYEGDDGTLEVFNRADVTLELDLVIDAPFYDEDEVPILPYAQPEGSGQFDAEVEPWGDDENVDVPM